MRSTMNSPSIVAPWIAPDGFAKEPQSALPLFQDNAFVPAEGVGIDAVLINLSGSFEALERRRVVLEVRKDVARSDPG